MKKICMMLTALLLLLSQVACAMGETFTLSMVGDCVVGDEWKYRGYRSGFTYKMTELGLDYPFSLCADLFAQDDLTLANCECVLTDRTSGKAKELPLACPTQFGEVFKLGNVDVCNMANNHGMDMGKKGREDTIATLEALGIGCFGESRTYTTTVKGVKIGFVGYSYPLDDRKMKKYEAALEELRAEGCTFVVASVHWGKESSLRINSAQKKYGTRFIDMGFDLVYGHGPHVCQPIQVYNGKLIFYSLSNFTFGANAAPKDDDTFIAQVEYDIQPNGTMTLGTLTCLPYKMHKDKDFRPWPLEEQKERETVFRKLVFDRKQDPDSNLPESFLTTGFADFRE